MFGFIRNLHNRRPVLWSVIAFIIVIAMAATLSIWWNVLLFQNHRILEKMTAAANDPQHGNIPLALLMVLGILCSLVIVAGLLYMFLRLIKSIQLNLAQSQFIAAVTHELRSPVAGLQLMLDTIRDTTTPQEKRVEFFERMDVDLRRLRGLVDQVLDTARLENFLNSAELEEMTVRGFLKACLETLDTRLKSASARLSLAEVPGGLTIKANKHLLMSAVTNVLDNAMKYSSAPAEIKLDVKATPTMVAIEITDKGIGISRKELKRVFRRFYRGDDPLTQSKAGTGLGLYFARLAMKAQGGSINVFSEGRGLGTTFRIEVPRR